MNSNYSTLTQATTSFPLNDTVQDTVQEIRFGQPDVFAAASWDGMIRFYQIQCQMGYRPQLSVEQKQAIDCGEPVISMAWKPDCSLLFGSLADNTIRAYDVKTGQSAILGHHEGCPARNLFWNDSMNAVISVGLDKNLRLWQVTQPVYGQKPKPVFEMQLSAVPTIADQDQDQKLLAYADIEQRIKWLEIEQLRGNTNSVVGRNPFYSEESRLTMNSQIQSLSISSRQKLIGIGSVDGRVSIQEMSSRMSLTSKIVFKCCKIEEDSKNYRSDKISKYFPVNCLQFNQRSSGSWVMTTGSDGAMTFWDIDKKNKILNLNYDKVPLTCGQVSPDGYFAAYAMGYDWSKGLDGVGEFGPRIAVSLIEDKHMSYSN